MNFQHAQRNARFGEPGSPAEEGLVLSYARMLRDASAAGSIRRLLQGKNIGLVCEVPDSAASTLFRSAATELGASVAHVKPSLSASSLAEEVQHTSRMLGRLYDAIEWQTESQALLALVQSTAGIPVYNGLGLPTHPTVALVARLNSNEPLEQLRRRVLQAVLVMTIV
jgi:ornithine carbamoyltransferase